jgi:probable non-F420 flavinoid oxidoreductase
MTKIGIHASHEQIPPGKLLAAVQRAERAGFGAAMSSDHFAPWSKRQNHSGFAWAWLGAALQATSLPFGVVNAPGQRYHPAIIAQAAATLEAMFPSRFWIAVGTGENSNEHITVDPWPPKDVRNKRLLECVDVMRRLFAGEEISHKGLITVDRARLYDVTPESPPPIVGAAVSTQTARWVGGWADGLITINQPVEKLEEMISAFREGGGAGKKLVLQVHLSYAATDEEALQIAHDQWRTNIFSPPIPWDLETVDHFDEAARHVRPEDMRGPVLISSDLNQHLEWLRGYAGLGFEEIYLHHVGQELDDFIDAFGEHVLPELQGVTAR